MQDTTAQDQLHFEIQALNRERIALQAIIEAQTLELDEIYLQYEELLSYYSESATA